MHKPADIEKAYVFCQEKARNHYENFPVASILLPKKLRKPVSVIYAFARTADDMADEGDIADEERLAQLQDYKTRLEHAANNQADNDPVFIALADLIQQYPAIVQPLKDLLIAFRSDVTTKRYQTPEQLLDYCRYSANPVGRLVLLLSGHSSQENIFYSDSICSALQLINFLQDIDIDYQDKQRIYIPLDDMQHFGITEADLAEKRNSNQLELLVKHQINRAQDLLDEGAALAKRLPGRLGLEIKFTVAGGRQVIQALRRRKDVFTQPRLRRRDWLSIAARALFA